MVGLAFLRVPCDGLVVFRFLGVAFRVCVFGVARFSGDGRRQFEYGRLECVHLKAYIGGILAFFDGFECQNGVQGGNIVAVRPFFEDHFLVDLDDFNGRMVVSAG